MSKFVKFYSDRVAKKNPVKKMADRDGNGDDVFQATNIKETTPNDGAGTAGHKLASPGAEAAQYEQISEETMDGKDNAEGQRVRHGKKKGTVQMTLRKGESHIVDWDNGSQSVHRGSEIHKLDESEQIQELSKKTLGSYIRKATSSVSDTSKKMGDKESFAKKIKTRPGNVEGYKSLAIKHQNRKGGIAHAVDKLTKEDEDLQELSKKTLGSYIKAATKNNDAREARLNSQGREGYDSDKWKKRDNGLASAYIKLTKEDEQLDELSRNTLKSYIKKASVSMQTNDKYSKANAKAAKNQTKQGESAWAADSQRLAAAYAKHSEKRFNGIVKASNKFQGKND